MTIFIIWAQSERKLNISKKFSGGRNHTCLFACLFAHVPWGGGEAHDLLGQERSLPSPSCIPISGPFSSSCTHFSVFQGYFLFQFFKNVCSVPIGVDCSRFWVGFSGDHSLSILDLNALFLFAGPCLLSLAPEPSEGSQRTAKLLPCPPKLGASAAVQGPNVLLD
jgi:hypothetical protein